jgi:hypothetical protein
MPDLVYGASLVVSHPGVTPLGETRDTASRRVRLHLLPNLALWDQGAARGAADTVAASLCRSVRPRRCARLPPCSVAPDRRPTANDSPAAPF